MTTLRPPTPRPTPPSGRPLPPSQRPRPAAPPPPKRGGFAAIVPLRRMFAAEQRDSVLLIGVTLFLVALGLVMVLSASSVEGEASGGDAFARAGRQALFAALGVPLMLVAGRMPMSFWKRWAWPAVVAGGIMQLLVFIPGLSYSSGGNRNWIVIGGFTFQPSEFLKLALIAWIGVVLGSRRGELGSWRRLVLPVAPIAGAAVALVLAGGDLGTAAIILGVVFACAFFAGAKFTHLFVGGVGIAFAALLVAWTNPSRVARITAWMQGCDASNYSGYCWQPQHGFWALADGGVFGVGLGNSIEKWNWLPEADSDYIFAIIGEELGLIGAVVVLLLYAMLAVVLIRIIRKSTDDFARIATGGILVWIVGQAFVNVAVVLGMLPVLGVPLPLLSAGGSSLVTVLLALGVVLSFARAQGKAALEAQAEPAPRRTVARTPR